MASSSMSTAAFITQRAKTRHATKEKMAQETQALEALARGLVLYSRRQRLCTGDWSEPDFAVHYSIEEEEGNARGR